MPGPIEKLPESIVKVVLMSHHNREFTRWRATLRRGRLCHTPRTQ